MPDPTTATDLAAILADEIRQLAWGLQMVGHGVRATRTVEIEAEGGMTFTIEIRGEMA